MNSFSSKDIQVDHRAEMWNPGWSHPALIYSTASYSGVPVSLPSLKSHSEGMELRTWWWQQPASVLRFPRNSVFPMLWLFNASSILSGIHPLFRLTLSILCPLNLIFLSVPTSLFFVSSSCMFGSASWDGLRACKVGEGRNPVMLNCFLALLLEYINNVCLL